MLLERKYADQLRDFLPNEARLIFTEYCPASNYCTDAGCCPNGVSLADCGAISTLDVIPPPATIPPTTSLPATPLIATTLLATSLPGALKSSSLDIEASTTTFSRATTGATGSSISGTSLFVASTSIQPLLSTSEVSTGNGPSFSTSLAPVSTLNQELANAGSSNRNSGGLLPSAKIAIAVAVPLTVIIIAILVAVCLRRRYRLRQATGPQTREDDDGGLPEHVSTMVEIKHHPSRYPQNSHHFDQTGDAGIVSVYELDKTPTARARQFRHEGLTAIDSTSAVHELTVDEQGLNLGVEQLENTDSQRATLAASTPHTFALPWDISEGIASRSSTLVPAPLKKSVAEDAISHHVPDAGEDNELQQLESEMAQIRGKRERLQQLQVLESREEELRRVIEEKRLQRRQI